MRAATDTAPTNKARGKATGLRVLACAAWLAAATAAGVTAVPTPVPTPVATLGPTCQRPLYLTFDTGHMAVAPLVAQVLARQQVQATFFAAHEKTQTGDGSLGEHWAHWWRERGHEGHAFASHTWEHAYWLADAAPTGPTPTSPSNFVVRPSSGPQAGQRLQWTAQRYCASLHQASARLQQLTGQPPLPLFRAPGGKHSPALLQAASACGYAHVGWAAAGFLGDELPSDRHPNAQLLRQALARIRGGDILMAHLGIWSRQDAWAPAVLEPLIEGLKARGHCFATLRQHPTYRDWVRQHPLPPATLSRHTPPQGAAHALAN